MIGVRAPETCWAVNKIQDNKLEKLLHLVGDLFELNVNKFTIEYLVLHFRRTGYDFCENLQSHSSDIWSFCGGENLDGDYSA